MNADEKTCPRCAEAIKAKAVACRFCGYEYPQAQGSGGLPEVEAGTIGRIVLISALALGFAWMCSPMSKTPEDTAPSVQMLSAEQRKGCADVIAKQMKSGLVRERPAPNRVNVDEVRWAGLPAGEKQALLAFVLCDGIGKQPADMAFGDHVVAYGWRSGKRLAMLTQVGMSYE